MNNHEETQAVRTGDLPRPALALPAGLDEFLHVYATNLASIAALLVLLAGLLLAVSQVW